MAELNDQISKLVNEFVAQVSGLACRAAMETLESALSSAGPLRGGRRGASAWGARIDAAPGDGRRQKGAKRPADEIEQTKARLHDFIKRNPGQRIEQINKVLGTTTRDLALPIKKLVAENALRTEGEKRATAYFPGEVATAATSGRRGGRKKHRS